MAYEQLKLENQLCFPIYAASRLITRAYQPYLDQLGITYPQYLALLILWENDSIPVNDIAKRLLLNTNTITPLLKRMEQQKIVKRQVSNVDERKVIISLTEAGKKMKERASRIPDELAQNLVTDKIKVEELLDLKAKLTSIIKLLSEPA